MRGMGFKRPANWLSHGKLEKFEGHISYLEIFLPISKTLPQGSGSTRGLESFASPLRFCHCSTFHKLLCQEAPCPFGFAALQRHLTSTTGKEKTLF